VLLFSTAGAHTQPPGSALLESTFSNLPIYFIENRGVYPDDVAYYVKGADKTLFFTPEGITFQLLGRERGWVVKLAFVGARPGVVPRGEDRQPAVFSYFRGPEKDWKTGLPTYARVVYESLWPGIDLIYEGTVHELKYRFVVKPGADPSRIRLAYRGAGRVRLTRAGALEVETPEGGFEDAPPSAYQVAGGAQTPVRVAFDVNPVAEAPVVGFRVGRFDPTRPLILDPAIVVYCGYIGGWNSDYAYDIAVSPSGEAFVAGYTFSTENMAFPVKVGPFLTFTGSNYYSDAFVAKVDAAGKGLRYCGFIGGTASDMAYGIAVDALGNAYVAGLTNSTEVSFPVKRGPDVTHNGKIDAFVAKVNAGGTQLDYCGYIGGSANDAAESIAVDAAGQAYLTGYTLSHEASFPVKGGPDLTFNGGTLYGDAFVAKVTATGSGLVYCGYVGGAVNDRATGIAVDGAGNAYLSGYTTSDETSFPVKGGPDLTFNGTSTSYDAFVAKVNASGASLGYCGYVGGPGTDLGQGVAVDASGHAYLVGQTYSAESSFPVNQGPDLTHNGRSDGFVAKVSPAGSALVYCGYLGGSGYDFAFGVAVDAFDCAYVTGITQSTDFPVKVGPDASYNGGMYDVFVAKLKADGRATVFSGYLGGSLYDWSRRIAVDAARNVYIAGQTQSTEATFPVKVGPFLTHNQGYDVFVAKVALVLIDGDLTAVRPGETVSLTLTATDDAGRPYQVGSSFGVGPIRIDSRRIGLGSDFLLWASISGQFPDTFVSYAGFVTRHGGASARLKVPVLPVLIGLTIHSAFVTLDTSAPSGIRSISNTFSFSITR